MKKYLFIINPKASRCDLTKIEKIIRKQFDETNNNYEIVIITSENSLGNALKTISRNNIDTVIAAGGDGTINSVAESLLKRADIELGIIPVGTSNALAKELRIPIDIEESINLILNYNKIRRIDVMKMNGHFYCNRISAGLSSIAIKENTDDVKKNLGTFSYIWSGIGTFLDFKKKKFLLNIDGIKKEIEATDVVINNSETILFSNIKIGDGISIDDGGLELIVFKSDKVLEYLNSLKDAITTNLENENLDYYSDVKKILIETNEECPVQADGDIVGSTPVSIEIIPKAINVIVPE